MPKTPKEETEELLSAGMPFIEQTLTEHGEFFPIAVVKTTEGEIEHTAIGEQGTSAEVYELLETVLRTGAAEKKYRATAIFCDRRVKRPEDNQSIDAVHVGLEHQQGYSVDVFFPYTRSKQSVEFGEPFASARPAKFFAANSSSK